jgi:hypothetical protein
LINVCGSASVRHTSWRGCKYILGLNLSQNLGAKDLAARGETGCFHAATEGI